MTLDKLERQVLFWNKAAILVPIFFTGLLSIAWFFKIMHLDTLFFVACGLYFATAVVWWWWTMTSVRLLIGVLRRTQEGVIDAAFELQSIRKELQVDNQNNK
jgi:hypothetical protein